MLEAWSMVRCLERGAGMSEGMAVVRVVEGRLVLSCACCCYVPAYQAVCLSIGLCTSLLLHLRVRCGGLSLVYGVWRVACGESVWRASSSAGACLRTLLSRRFSRDASLVRRLTHYYCTEGLACSWLAT